MPYVLKFTKLFVSQYDKLERIVQEQVWKKLEEVKDNPFRYKRLAGPFRDCYRIHIGNYRIIFLVQKEEIHLIDVDLRSRIYIRDLKNVIGRIYAEIRSRK